MDLPSQTYMKWPLLMSWLVIGKIIMAYFWAGNIRFVHQSLCYATKTHLNESLLVLSIFEGIDKRVNNR